MTMMTTSQIKKIRIQNYGSVLKRKTNERSNLNHSPLGEQGGGFYCYLVMQQLQHQEEVKYTQKTLLRNNDFNTAQY